jgi:hypothetical protein
MDLVIYWWERVLKQEEYEAESCSPIYQLISFKGMSKFSSTIFMP